MEKILSISGICLAGWLFASCSPGPASVNHSVASPPAPTISRHMVRKVVAERMGAIVVTERSSLARWADGGFTVGNAPGDADGGSATPIAPDGYFLTADHVLARMAGRNVFVLYRQHGKITPYRARLVWRSESADLALLHIPAKTPYYYHWSSPQNTLPAGTGVIHGGIATGFKSAWGKLGTSIAPQGALTRYQRFKIDIPLKPGDSGGPVVDSSGSLVGINSAVEFLVPMETAIFIDSEANRPNTRMIDSIVQSDRNNQTHSSAVSARAH